MSSRSINLPVQKSLVAGISTETIHLLLVMLAAILVISPILIWGVPSSRDLSNHFRFALPFYDALRSGHLYPGWLAESNQGFGDASFRFYPPALYYLLSLARAITGNWYAATVTTFTAISMLGALGVYLWTREFASSRTAMWAGIFYSIAPYHLNQLFQALMLAEFAGAAVLPFVFLFAERVCRHRRPKDIAALAAAYALLVLTHLPLAVLGSIALLCYVLWRVNRKTIWRTISAVGISIALGLAASACYWTTMLIELNWIRADTLNSDPSVDYRKNFVLSTLSSDFLNVWWMNILLLVSLAMFWPALVLLFRKARPMWSSHTYANKPIRALAILLLLTLFMATPLSQPIWYVLRPLQNTQFPWRWLTITSMVCPILLAMAIPFWSRLAQGKKRPLVMIALGTMAMSLAFSLAHIVREARWLTPAQFEQTLSSIPGSPGVTQWFPTWAHEPLPNMSTPVEAADRQVTIRYWEPERRLFQVNPGATVEARVRTFYYPHWKATADGQELAVRPDQNGAMMVTLPREAANVTLEFREPKRVRYAAGLTLLGWGLIGGFSFKRRRARSQ